MKKKSPCTLAGKLAADRRALRAKRMLVRDCTTSRTLALVSRVFDGCSVSINLAPDSVYVAAMMSDLDSFRSGALPDALGALLDAGFVFTSTSDYPSLRNRDYTGKLGRVRITVSAYLSSAGGACHIKKVGTRTEDVFELVCD